MAYVKMNDKAEEQKRTDFRDPSKGYFTKNESQNRYIKDLLNAVGAKPKKDTLPKEKSK